jgi:ABC-2 type transport system ATP-binding protein
LTPVRELLIQAESLTISFGSVHAVQDLSISVAAGEIYALVGPDGAGKTSAIRLLCGALRPQRGSVRLAGFAMAANPEAARASLGYLPQRFSLYGDLTVEENLRFLAEVRGLPPQEWTARSHEILDFVGLTAFLGRRADALSGGMRQKLGLAAALVHRPQVLLLDEPTAGVDPVTRQNFWQLLLRILPQGVGVLLSTPYMDEAQRCSRVGLMSGGRILAEGPPADLRRELQGRILELRGSPRRALLEAARGDPAIEAVQPFGDRIHARLGSGQAQDAGPRLAARARALGASVLGTAVVSPSLEDLFLYRLEQEGLRA